LTSEGGDIQNRSEIIWRTQNDAVETYLSVREAIPPIVSAYLDSIPKLLTIRVIKWLQLIRTVGDSLVHVGAVGTVHLGAFEIGHPIKLIGDIKTFG
jgi:hypothetical protein